MLKTILGSESGAGVLAFLVLHREGHASEIARYIDMDLFAVQKQLEKYRASSLLHSRVAGRARVYAFNPEYPMLAELKTLIEKALSIQPQPEQAGPPVPLPESLRVYFWDYVFEEQTWEKDRDLIIRRLLTNGSWEAITWLRRRIGDAGLRAWLIAHHGRGLNPRQLRFWSLVLALPKSRADAWTKDARLNPWNQR